MRKIPLFLLIIALFSCGGKENPSLNQKIRGEGERSLILKAGPEEVWVGVPFTLELTMKGEKEDDVLFPKIGQSFLPEGLLLRDYRADDNLLILTVKAEKAGVYAIPPLNVLFDNAAGGVELLTRPVEFEVVSLIQEGEELSPLAGSRRIGFLTTLQTVIAIAALLVAGLFLFWLLYWRKRVKITPPEPIWITLERGKTELLADENLMEGDRGVFYDRSVSLVKKALDGVYGENTGERTREEFMESLLLSSRYEAEVKAWFVKFFERADMVRFARSEVARDRALADLDETVRFVSRAAEEAQKEEEDKS
ncbi:MAG: hypothetical protein PQJ59_07025 [Spirochaetales bacterium]|nr:hypothetical protein [Spirochaetales bacterium]